MAAVVDMSIGIANRIKQTIAVITSSMADAKIFRIELKFFRKRLVMIPQSALFSMTMKTMGSVRIRAKVSPG
jgi:hypothetical protein